MTKLKYWIECLNESLESHGIILAPEKIELIAKDIECSHECMDMAFPVPDFNPYRDTSEKLKVELVREKSKVHCRTCDGRGVITSYGPIHSGTSSCYKCNGEGRHLP